MEALQHGPAQITALVNNAHWAGDGTSQLAVDGSGVTLSTAIANPTSGTIGLISTNPSGVLTASGQQLHRRDHRHGRNAECWQGRRLGRHQQHRQCHKCCRARKLGPEHELKGTFNYTGNTATYTRGFVVNNGGGEIDTATSGQTLTISGGNITGIGPLTIGGVGNTTIASSIATSYAGTASALTKTGTGTLMLSGTNTFQGTTSVSAPSCLPRRPPRCRPVNLSSPAARSWADCLPAA